MLGDRLADPFGWRVAFASAGLTAAIAWITVALAVPPAGRRRPKSFCISTMIRAERVTSGAMGVMASAALYVVLGFLPPFCDTRRSMAICRPPRCECHPSATPGIATRHPFGHCPTMRSSSECVWTVSRFYRGHRIVAVQLDGTWHVVLHGYQGPSRARASRARRSPTPWGKPSGLSRAGSPSGRPRETGSCLASGFRPGPKHALAIAHFVEGPGQHSIAHRPIRVQAEHEIAPELVRDRAPTVRSRSSILRHCEFRSVCFFARRLRQDAR